MWSVMWAQSMWLEPLAGDFLMAVCYLLSQNMCCMPLADSALWLLSCYHLPHMLPHALISPCGLTDTYDWPIALCFIVQLSLNMPISTVVPLWYFLQLCDLDCFLQPCSFTLSRCNSTLPLALGCSLSHPLLHAHIPFHAVAATFLIRLAEDLTLASDQGGLSPKSMQNITWGQLCANTVSSYCKKYPTDWQSQKLGIANWIGWCRYCICSTHSCSMSQSFGCWWLSTAFHNLRLVTMTSAQHCLNWDWEVRKKT